MDTLAALILIGLGIVLFRFMKGVIGGIFGW